MLSKCANSSCSNPFLYLTKGKLYRMEIDCPPTEGTAAASDFASMKFNRRIEYFWLCDECAPRMTLTFKKGIGIKAMPAERMRTAAAALS